MTDILDNLRSRLRSFEERAKKIDGSSYHLATLHLSTFGWTANVSLKLAAPSAARYFEWPNEALDDLDRRLSAREDADGSLARTLGVEVAA